MAEIYILRHAEKETREENSPLSTIGIKQAEATAKYLEHRNIGSIHSSPLRRALHTSEIIAARLGLQVIPNIRLRERLAWGDRKEETYEQFLEEWRKTQSDKYYKPPYGDSRFISGNRIKQVVDEVGEAKNDACLLVTHSGAIGDFLETVFPDELLPFYIEPVAKVRMVEILYCSITVVEVNKGQYTLKKVNDTSYLPT